MELKLNLPVQMEFVREDLLDTLISYIRVSAGEQRILAPWTSKVGGLPYFPKGQSFPIGVDGRPLYFLAQINFSEVPQLTPFPAAGLLQFYIGDDDLYGMNFDDGFCQDQFRVIYHPDVQLDTNLLHESITCGGYDLLPHHPEECYPLNFSIEREYLPNTDYQFNDRFGADFFQRFGGKEWEVVEQFGRMLRSQGHKLGGYAYFTQDDPRLTSDPMMLLLQLDSDEGMDLMWGDMGVGHFFIRSADLAELRFDRVLYDWDCL